MTPHEFTSALMAVGVTSEGEDIVVITEDGVSYAGSWARVEGTLNLITLTGVGVKRALDVTRVYAVWTYKPSDQS